MTRILIPTALVVALAASTAHAQATAKPRTRTPQTQTQNQDQNRPQDQNRAGTAQGFDALFAQAAAISGLAEVAISELGQKKATDPRLQELSERMVAEHTKLNQELKELASEKGITLSSDHDARAKFCLQSLTSEPKESFDHCYAKAQLTLHMEAASAFEAEAKHGQDPDIKEMASKALTKIQEHISMLEPIVEEMDRAHEGQTERSGRTKAQGTERPGSVDRPGATERPNRTERPGATERPNRTERPGGTERPQN